MRRPDDDDSLPGVWGLPAVSLARGESEEDGVRRAGREKLGVEVEPLEPVGCDGSMTDWEARLLAGEPKVPQPGSNTQYTGLRWGEPAASATRCGSGTVPTETPSQARRTAPKERIWPTTKETVLAAIASPAPGK